MQLKKEDKMANGEKQKKVTFISVLEAEIAAGKQDDALVNGILASLPNGLKAKFDEKKVRARLNADLKYLARKAEKKQAKAAKKAEKVAAEE